MLTVAGNEWRPQHPDRLYPGDEEQLPDPLIVVSAPATGLLFWSATTSTDHGGGKRRAGMNAG